MILQQKKINTVQLYSMFYIFRMVGTFTYMLRLRAPLSATDRAIMAFCYLFFSVAFAAPVLICIGNEPHIGLMAYVKNTSKKTQQCIGLFYMFTFLWSASVVASRFSLFSGIVLLQQENLGIFMLILVGVSIYCASKGPEPLARTGVIVAVLLFVSLLLMTLTVVKEFDAVLLPPPLQTGLSSVVYQGFHSACRNIETTSLLFIAPKTSGNLRKGYLPWILFFCLQLASLFLLAGGIAAEYGELQMFPLYTLAALAKIGILERMDDLLTGVWVICAMLKIAFLLHTATQAAEQGSQKKPDRLLLLLLGGLFVFGSNLFLSQNISFFGKFIASPVNPVLFILATVLVPCGLMLRQKLHRRKRKEKSS